MKLSKYIFIFFSVFLLSHSTMLHAETIKIKGYIVEMTCTQNSPNTACPSLSVSKIQQLSESKIKEEILKNKNNNVAQLQITNITDQSHKILLINYY